MTHSGDNGSGPRGWSPFKRRSYRYKCPYPGCGIAYGTMARVGEHLEVVHHIYPVNGVYHVPKTRP